MAKRENQKFKSFLVAQYLLKYSDENHAVSAGDIISYLSDEFGIEAERRSIYKDIAELQEILSADEDNNVVIEYDSKRKGYKVTSHQFEFDELRLLAECVHAAKFISAEQAKNLVNTIGEFGSAYQAEALSHEVFLVDRVKTANKSIMASISTINEAMSKHKDGKPHTPQKISFKYMRYSLNDRTIQVARRQGASYVVSPYKLLINEGNYYLLAYNEEAQGMRTYRVDRMKSVQLVGEPRAGAEAFAAIDLSTYTQRVFSMFGGEQKRISIRFINPLLDTAIERFGTGKDVFYRPDDERHFVVTADIEVSDQFFAWVCGFGKKARIIEPSDLVNEMAKFLNDINEMYISE